MNALTVAAALGFALVAAPTLAQKPKQPPPAQQQPAAQKPATPPPAQPAPPAPEPPAPEPPRPFPEGARMAFVELQRLAAESAEGKAAAAQINALQQKKLAELNEKNEWLQAVQKKLQSAGALTDDARARLQKEAEKLQVDIQRAQQDAQAEVEELQRELQAEFQKKLMPVLQQVAQEKGLQMLLAYPDAGIVWADAGLDLSADVIKRMDAAAAGTAPKPPQQ
jgi:outer membrane protein